MYRKSLIVLLTLAVTLMLAAIGFAQGGGTEAASGLNSPRGLAVDSDGNLYVAEAGAGGESTFELFGQEAAYGPTSQITMITPEGEQSVLLPYFSGGMLGPETLGLNSVAVTDDAIYFVAGTGAPNQPLTASLIVLDRATLRMIGYADMLAYEIANNPDGTEEINSNPVDVAVAEDGTVYVVDSGMNAILTWSIDGGLELFHVWPENPVPTGIDFAADGSIYISFLGAEIAPGAGHVEHWSADGMELLETFEGLTAVTDVLVGSDGTVYAVELLGGFGETGPTPDSGRVVTLAAGAEPAVFAEGLNTPYSVAQDADGNIYVSTNTAFAAPGSGAVMQFAGGM